VDLPDGDAVLVGSLSLPAGHYLLTAKTQVTNKSYDSGPVVTALTCRLYVNYDNGIDGSVIDLDADDNSTGDTDTFVLQGTVYYTQPGYAVVECDVNPLLTNISAYESTASNTTITAIQTQAIN
jgi:hypothetical protein